MTRVPRQPVVPVVVTPQKPIAFLLDEMSQTAFQGRRLGEAFQAMETMLRRPNVTVLWGLAGSLATAGQWRIVTWLIEAGLVDVLVSTGANLSEDLLNAMGFEYWHVPPDARDDALFRAGFNRYYDVCARESDYMRMTELIAEFIETLDSKHDYSSREFLAAFGLWLHARGIGGITTAAALAGVPIFSPALVDSPYGDAALIAHSRGFRLRLDSVKDYQEFMSLSRHVRRTGVVYVGGGVPKDFIQLFAVTGNLLYTNRRIPKRRGVANRNGTDEVYYPHSYAVQITTDAPQWGGLSGASLREGISWGKAAHDAAIVDCYCDATIALPLLAHGLAERLKLPRDRRRLDGLLESPSSPPVARPNRRKPG